nr:reverse transcriptase domain-containing protein [Tanacetum cinerariifolium]
MLKALLSNKKKLQELANTPLNKNCSAVIIKKLPEKLGDPEKFLIPCGFNELKCKALADLGNGYSRKRQKQSPKRQNRTRNEKDQERQSHSKPKVKSQIPSLNHCAHLLTFLAQMKYTFPSLLLHCKKLLTTPTTSFECQVGNPTRFQARLKAKIVSRLAQSFINGRN